MWSGSSSEQDHIGHVEKKWKTAEIKIEGR
jgi:hypothetical protein